MHIRFKKQWINAIFVSKKIIKATASMHCLQQRVRDNRDDSETSTRSRPHWRTPSDGRSAYAHAHCKSVPIDTLE
jgi:hypothetical protein